VRAEMRQNLTGGTTESLFCSGFRLSRTLAFVLVLMTFSAFEPHSAHAVTEADAEPLVVPNAFVHQFQPEKLDIALRLYVSVPDVPPPDEGFPVLYAFDADISFIALADMARNVTMSARRVKRAPPLVVGIGYAAPEDHLKRRIYDLTPPTDIGKLPKRPNGLPWPKTGGGDAFLDVLIDEIKPFIAARYPVDDRAETLAGHSLGGLLVLHALLTRADAFDRYVASSPSLWFGDRETSDKLIAFQEQTARSVSRKIPLRLTVGRLEETPTGWRAQKGQALEQRKVWLKNNRMIGNTKDLAEALTKINGAIQVSFDIYSGLGHAAANYPAFYQALEFAVGPDAFRAVGEEGKSR